MTDVHISGIGTDLRTPPAPAPVMVGPAPDNHRGKEVLS